MISITYHNMNTNMAILLSRRLNVLALSLMLSAFAYAQKSVTVKFSNESAAAALRKVEQLSGVKIQYNYEDVNFRVTLTATNQPAEKVVNDIVSGHGLKAQANGKYIVVVKAPTPQKSATSRIVTGQVYDEYGEPLAGVSVQVTENKTVGTATDIDGKFVLKNLPENAKSLTLSYIGMKTQQVKLGKSNNLKVVLAEDTKSIKEFVVNGYQQIDRRNLTSSTYTVDMEDVYMPGVANLDQMLEGKIPDMVVNTNSGEINSTARLRVRGTSTLIGNREPLWVLDGIILNDPIALSSDVLNDPDYVNRIGNAISGINPQDIDRIDVLKDAAATALYGTRAANGVIVITTKVGHVGRPVVSYSAQGTFRARPRYTDRKVNLMNSNERVQFSQDLIDSHYTYPSGMPLVGYEYAVQQLYARQLTQDEFDAEVNAMAARNTDWFKELDHDSFSQDHSVNVSGGSDKVRYYTSIGFTDQDDVIKNTTNRRYTAMAKINIKLASKLDMEFNANGYLNDRKYNAEGVNPTDYAYNTSRTIPAYNQDGSYYYYMTQPGGTIPNLKYSILNELDNSYSKQSVSSVMATLNMRYRPLDCLDFNWTTSVNTSSSNMETWYGEQSYYISSLRRCDYGEIPDAMSLCPYGGELRTNNGRNTGFTTRLQGNFNKYLGEDKQHMFNVSAGLEVASTTNKGMSRTDRMYFADRGKTVMGGVTPEEFPSYFHDFVDNNVPTFTDGLNNIISVYGTLTYAYKTLFTLNVNGRSDGSNRFGNRSNEKILPVWSVSGNANLLDICKIENNWMDNLMLKASYGEQGNMIDGQTPVMIIKKGSLNPTFKEFQSTVTSFSNPDLKWEKTRSFNVGVESAFFNNRVQIGAEYYFKRTEDAFMDKTISDINGYTKYTINSGTITNQGYNVTWSFTPVKVRDFYWILSGNCSKVFNSIKTAPGADSYELEDFLTGRAIVKGQAVGTFYSYRFAGLSPVDGGPLFYDMEEQEVELNKLDNYHTYTKVLKPTGKREYDLTGSFTNTFTYKQWRLGISCSYGIGANTRLFRLFDNMYSSYSSEANASRELIDRWRQPGDEMRTNTPAIISRNSPNYFYYSAHYSSGYPYYGAKIATDAYGMYDYSDVRVVSADFLKIQMLSLTYEFSKKMLNRLHLSRLAITGSGSNLYTFCDKKLRGQTPTQGGFSEVQLSERPTFTLSLNVQF